MQCCMLQAGAAVSHLCMMDCRMEAKGVTPMPVPMSTACCAWKIRLVGAPKGPSMKTCSELSMNLREVYIARCQF